MRKRPISIRVLGYFCIKLELLNLTIGCVGNLPQECLLLESYWVIDFLTADIKW